MTPMDVSGPNDRLTTMLFVAALFHGVLILGVSFTDGPLFDTPSTATSMEVVLLTRDFEKQASNDDAEYLAQQNLSGSGNTTDEVGIRVAYGRDAQPIVPGPEQDGSANLDRRQQQFDSAPEQLYAQRTDGGTLSAGLEQNAERQQQRTSMAGSTNSVEILAAPDTQTLLQSAKPRELIVSANTRESRIAAYLDGWKRRIERVGTMNFPRSAASAAADRNPVLEVNISADGRLQEALILAGSGSRELDMAAVKILRLASPFDPFPEYLRNDYDALKFSYEWQFDSGSVGNMQTR
jgi:protein TonB